ncbi:MAG: Proclavaminate amidinohydrolase [Gemmatimonadaceae bacterium]|nr:Proclavaminate amidinohydrolase [Gemmatimonadaceae bacterium]
MPSATLIGVPYDAKSSYARGPALAPDAIRAALWSQSGNRFSEGLIEVLSPDHLGDYGNIAIESEDYPLLAIENAVSLVLNRSSIPLVLGGDHSITYGVVRTVARAVQPFTILHLDAHNDLHDSFAGDRLSHASPFARIMEERLTARLVQVGIRCLTPNQRDQANRFAVQMIDMTSWTAGRRPEIEGPCYLSLDMDVLDPAFAPGLSHREPGGLSPRDVIGLIQSIPGPLVAADIVELNPVRDWDGITALVAARFVKEVVSRIASSAR